MTLEEFESLREQAYEIDMYRMARKRLLDLPIDAVLYSAVRVNGQVEIKVPESIVEEYKTKALAWLDGELNARLDKFATLKVTNADA